MTARREYGSGSVFQRKSDGRWIGRLEVGLDHLGERRRVQVSGTSEAVVRRKLKEKAREVAKDGYQPGSTRTVREWASTWLEITEKRLRPKPFAANKSITNKWIVPTIGARKLDRLNRADIRRVHDAQREAKLSASSIHRTHTILVKMLKDAQAEGYTVPQSVLTMAAPAKGVSDRQALPVDDAVALLRVISEAPDPSRWLAVLLQALRQAERLGMTWDCIDLDAGVLEVSWQLQELRYKPDGSKDLHVPDGYEYRRLDGRWCLVRPKTAAGRRVMPMTTWMVKSLRVWRDIAPASEHDLVWCRDDGGPLDPKKDLAEWKAMQTVAGIKHPTRDHYVLHEGRHTTATLLRELGASDEVIMSIMGHSSMLSSRPYIHEDLLVKAREVMAALDERLSIAS